MPDLGRDVGEYLGGAGFTYQSVAEAREIVSKPYPSELRDLGFEVAKRSDIAVHKHVLTDLWADYCPDGRRDASDLHPDPQ
jgi:hypothetical protein